MLLQNLVVYIHLNKNMLVQKYTNDAKKMEKKRAWCVHITAKPYKCQTSKRQ